MITVKRMNLEELTNSEEKVQKLGRGASGSDEDPVVKSLGYASDSVGNLTS